MQVDALHTPRFRCFWGTQTISLVGTWTQTVSIPLLVYGITGSPFYLGLTGATLAIPVTVCTLFFGAVLDRLRPVRTVAIAEFTMMAVSVSLFFVARSGYRGVWPILGLCLVSGIANSIDLPGRQLLLKRVVGADHLPQAIALTSVTFNLARMVGPSAAAVAISALGLSWCFAISALARLPFLISICWLKEETSRPQAKAVRGVTTVVSDVFEGLKYAMLNRDIATTIVRTMWMGIFAFNFSVTLPVLIHHDLGASETTYALFTTFIGCGSLGASVALTMLPNAFTAPTYSRMMPTLTGALLGIVGLVHNIYAVEATLFLIGFNNVIFFTKANVHVQTAAGALYQGRLVSIFVFCFGGMTPVGNMLAGSLASIYGAVLALVLLGISLSALDWISQLVLFGVYRRAAQVDA